MRGRGWYCLGFIFGFGFVVALILSRKGGRRSGGDAVIKV